MNLILIVTVCIMVIPISTLYAFADTSTDTMPPRRVVVFVPDLNHPEVGELRNLYKDGVDAYCDAGAFARALTSKPSAAVVLTNPGPQVIAAASPNTLIMCTLKVYAELRGLHLKRHEVEVRPGMRFVAMTPWLSGLKNGQQLPWYGTREKRYLQQSLSPEGLPSEAQVLALSSVDGGPMLVVEQMPNRGQLIALDLESPNGKPGYDGGSKYKWYFLARFLDPRPFYGEFVPTKPSFQEYIQGLDNLAKRYPGRVVVSEVGKGAAGDPVISVRLGREDLPRFVFSAVLHGAEVQNAYGLRRLIEVALENPAKDSRITALLERYGVEILPIVNVWGYIHNTQVNSRDCDLNRNFDYMWREYKGDGGWRAKYKPEVLRGAAPFSEGEARALRDRLLSGKVAGYLDFHQHEMKHGHLLWLPHKPVQRRPEAFAALHEALNARLTGRYLFGDEALQVRINRTGSATPFAQNWAAAQGIPSCVIELPGGFEDSLILTDILVLEALHFMWALQ